MVSSMSMITIGGHVHPLARPGSECAHAYTGVVAARARYTSLRCRVKWSLTRAENPARDGSRDDDDCKRQTEDHSDQRLKVGPIQAASALLLRIVWEAVFLHEASREATHSHHKARE